MRDLDALLDELTSDDDERAEAAAQQIAAWGSAAVRSLLEMLGGDNPDQRWWAVRTLTGFAQREARQAICRALTDPSPAVRQCAALSLRECPSTDAIPFLIDSLQDSDRLFARFAGDALEAAGDLAAPALIEALMSEVPYIRIEAARALARMHAPQAIPALFAALEDPSPLVTYWAEEGLRNAGVEMLFFKA
jgi:HEAT repeat protein